MNKIKFSIYYLLFVICAPNAFAQTYVPFNYSPKFIGSEIVTGSLAVGQTISAETSAVAEFESTTQGFLIPRMTEAQRDAISSPATGLLIYQTDGTEGFYYYTGAAWASIGLSTPVSVANGGTGISSYAIGDIIYASGATTLSKLPIGTANQQLRVNAGATALEYFTPASSGITVGTTTITSGTTLRVPYNNAGVYSELANFTMGSVAAGYLDVPIGYAIAGKRVLTVEANEIYCVGGGTMPTTTYAAIFGDEAGTGSQSARGLTAIGFGAARGAITGTENISLGAASNYGGGTFSYSLFVGSSSSSSAGMNNTASNQAVFGMPLGNGYTQFYFGQGVSAVAGTPSGVTFNATPGTTAGGLFTIAGGAASGTDIPGGNLVLRAGVSNGNNASTTQGDVDIQSCITPLASGTTAQTPVSVFKIKKSGAIEISTKVIDVTSGDAATINSTVGRFRKDNSGATFTLTNSLIVANSVILLTPANAAIDASATTWTVSAGVGSATITFNAAPAADFNMNFFVLN